MTRTYILVAAAAVALASVIVPFAAQAPLMIAS